MRVLARFNEIPDEALNTRTWQHFTRVSKYFGAIAENVQGAIENTISLEECLNRIADTFAASESELQKCRESLAIVEDFLGGFETNERIRVYLALSEVTNDQSIEELRARLKWALRSSFTAPTDAANREVGYVWERFQREFSGHFAFEHDAVMKSHDLQERFSNFIQGESWWEFLNFSRSSNFDPKDRALINSLARKIKELGCGFDVRRSLQTVPFCRCSFSLYTADSVSHLISSLIRSTETANERFRTALVDEAEKVSALLKNYAEEIGDQDYSSAARSLGEGLCSNVFPSKLSAMEMTILSEVCVTPFSAEHTEEDHFEFRSNPRRSYGSAEQDRASYDRSNFGQH